MATVINFGVPQLSGGGSDSPILMPKLAYRFRVTLLNFFAPRVNYVRWFMGSGVEREG